MNSKKSIVVVNSWVGIWSLEECEEGMIVFVGWIEKRDRWCWSFLSPKDGGDGGRGDDNEGLFRKDNRLPLKGW